MFWRRTAYLSVYLFLVLSICSNLSSQIATAQTPPLTKPHRVQAQIINGQPADVNEWPWQVYILAGPFQCGGTLIDPQWVLTASHCLLDEVGDPLTAAEVTVRLGIHDLNNLSGVQVVSAAEVFLHEEYSLFTNDNDIALIKLSEPAQLNEGVALVRLILDKEEFDGLTAAPAMGWITGWGTTESVVISTILQEASVPVVDNVTCNAPDSYNGRITDNMLCAGYPAGGIDACSGDSGGPLVMPDGETWAQAGIISWGEQCAQPNYYGVYVSVYRYKEWLTNYVDGLVAPTAPPLPTLSPTLTDIPPTDIPPTNTPTNTPTLLPPTALPPTATFAPTNTPTATPTLTPTLIITPTLAPTLTMTPTVAPTVVPSVTLTVAPTVTLTAAPTLVPTVTLTVAPTLVPTVTLTVAPTVVVTDTATAIPTAVITATTTPSTTPTIMPTAVPSETVVVPISPTIEITVEPTVDATVQPTVDATVDATVEPTVTATLVPSVTLTVIPTEMPTEMPTEIPTGVPAEIPTAMPTETPTAMPPTVVPTDTPAPTATLLPLSTPSRTPASPPSLPVMGELKNAGFELGANGDWLENSTQFGDQGSLIYSAALLEDSNFGPYDGNYLAWLGGANMESSTLLQTVLLPNSGQIVLRFHYFIHSEDECDADVAQITINDDALLELTLCSESNSNGWLEGSVDLSAYAAQTATLGIRVQTDDEKFSSFFVDSLSLDTNETYTPDVDIIEPTTTSSIDLPLETSLPSQIQYGDFEQSAGWFEGLSGANGSESMIVSTIGNSLGLDAHSGTHMAVLGMAHAQNARLSQRIQLPDAEQVALRFMYQIRSTDACGYDSLNVFVTPISPPNSPPDTVLSDQNAESIASYPLCSDNQTDEWISATLDLSWLRNRTVEILFAADTDTVGLSGVYIDDVEILVGDAVAVVVAPQAIQIEVVKDAGAPATAYLRIDAPDEMHWRAEVSEPEWLSITQDGSSSTVVESAGSAKLGLNFDTTSLAVGRYSGTVVLTRTDSGSTAALQSNVPVELTLISSPSANFVPEPLALVAQSGVSGNSLSWTVSTNPHVSRYRVARQQGNAFRTISAVSAAASFMDIVGPDNLLLPQTPYCYRVDGLVAPERAAALSVSAQLPWAQSNTVCLSYGALNLSLPDVTAAPGDKIVLPVYLQRATDLRLHSGQLSFTFDARLLRVTNIQPTAFAPQLAWSSETTNLDANVRQLTVTFERTAKAKNAEEQITPINGDGPLFLIKAKVMGDDQTRANLSWMRAAHHRAMPLSTRIVAEDADGTKRDLPLTVTDGVLTISESAQLKLGDVDGNSLVQIADAQTNLALAVAKKKPRHAQLRAGDLTGDRQIRAADAAMILYYARSNGVWPFDMTDSQLVQSAALREPAGAAQNEPATVGFTTDAVVPGAPFTSTLWIHGLVDFTSADFVISYDPTIVAGVNSVSLLAHESMAGYLLGFRDNQAGQLRIALAGDVPLQGDWSLIHIEMQARDDAAVGAAGALSVANIAINDQLGRNQADPIRGTGVTVAVGQIEVVDPAANVPDEDDARGVVFLPLMDAGTVLE